MLKGLVRKLSAETPIDLDAATSTSHPPGDDTLRFSWLSTHPSTVHQACLHSSQSHHDSTLIKSTTAEAQFPLVRLASHVLSLSPALDLSLFAPHRQRLFSSLHLSRN